MHTFSLRYSIAMAVSPSHFAHLCSDIIVCLLSLVGWCVWLPWPCDAHTKHSSNAYVNKIFLVLGLKFAVAIATKRSCCRTIHFVFLFSISVFTVSLYLSIVIVSSSSLSEWVCFAPLDCIGAVYVYASMPFMFEFSRSIVVTLHVVVYFSHNFRYPCFYTIYPMP